MKRLLKHINTGVIKEFDEEHALEFLKSPSWFEVDRQGHAIPPKKKVKPLNPVHQPPVFKKTAKKEEATS